MHRMMAYGGVDDGIFQAAFLDSGAATGLTPIPKPEYNAWQQHYDRITSVTRYVSSFHYCDFIADN